MVVLVQTYSANAADYNMKITFCGGRNAENLYDAPHKFQYSAQKRDKFILIMVQYYSVLSIYVVCTVHESRVHSF